MIKKQNKLLVIIFLLHLFFLFILIFLSLLFRNQIIELQNEKTRSSNTIDIDWLELYPYNTVVGEEEHDRIESDTNLYDVILNKISILTTLVNNWPNSLYNYQDIAKVGYVINSFITDPTVGNTYIKLNNEYWVTSCNSEITMEYAEEIVHNYSLLQYYLNEKNIDFLYFITPVKECKFDPELPDGIVSYSNDNIDTYIKAMDEYALNYVDLRDNLHNQKLDHYEMFYVTDHHWTVEAGLWASSQIVDELNNKYGFTMSNPIDIGTYNSVVYPNAEFGSSGQGVTHFVADSEDFVMLYPNYDTEYRLEVPNKGVDVTGDFANIFVDQEGLEELSKSGGGSAYGKILFGNPPYEKITNFNNVDGPKILMIRDSFSIVVAPYLAASCSELVMLDTRPNNGNFNGSIISCINEFEPDIVICLQSTPQSININNE